MSIKNKQKLLEKFGDPEKIYNLSRRKLSKIKYLSKTNIEEILDIQYRDTIDSDIAYMEENKIKLLNFNDEEYPELLKNIYDYPISIYVAGNSKILNNQSIAIIGCRNLSIYGEKAAKYFSENLAEKQINIVSGLAKGIDSIAHKGALIKKGITVAVIGSGIDIRYPKENINIYDEIIDAGGAIITEYPIGAKVQKMNFPARNRIISGISDKILVVEAKRKSGTLITVDFGLEQGKDIYVVPGNINEENSLGTNDLLREGAKPALIYEDLLINY